jgi:hypothetical protein
MLKYRLDALARPDELAKVVGVTNEAFDAYSSIVSIGKDRKRRNAQ